MDQDYEKKANFFVVGIGSGSTKREGGLIRE
jgi:hypothetical protein